MIIIAVGCVAYGEDIWAMGETPEKALKELIFMCEEIDMDTVKFYEARDMNLRVDTNPVIVSRD